MDKDILPFAGSLNLQRCFGTNIFTGFISLVDRHIVCVL